LKIVSVINTITKSATNKVVNMVISPDEAKTEALRTFAPKLEALEKIIDKALVKGCGDRVSVPISTGYVGPYDDPSTHMPYKVIETLLDFYRQAGWRAKLHNDQREGTWIEFDQNSRKKTIGFGPYEGSGQGPYE
jgi:hypothetical protein